MNLRQKLNNQTVIQTTDLRIQLKLLLLKLQEYQTAGNFYEIKYDLEKNLFYELTAAIPGLSKHVLNDVNHSQNDFEGAIKLLEWLLDERK